MRPTRREFLASSAAVGLAAATNASSLVEPALDYGAKTVNKTMMNVPFEKHKLVRIAMVGCGARGQSVLGDILGLENVRITAVCDIDPAKVKAAQADVVKAGQPEPAGFSDGDHAYEKLMMRDDIDVVYIATPWDWHVPMALFAMENGKHAAVEVPAALTVKDCWKLVDTSERTRKHCIMMENCCYGYWEMFVMNAVRQGAFGDLTHGEAAYIHDLREILTENASEGLWRRAPHTKHNGNFYPTHGLGPVAWYMGINRGDRFDRIVSMSSREHSLSQFVEKTFPANDPKCAEKYIAGDMSTSMIKTELGRTIMVQHDVVSPRPYDRLNMISGTKGAFKDYPPRIAIGNDTHKWTEPKTLASKYEHKLWTEIGELARKLGGHGGMDFIMFYRLVECMQKGLAPDMDVYDAVAWSVPVALSEQSLKSGSNAVKFPDFTRGKWIERKPLVI
jgi:hypothetical protein